MKIKQLHSWNVSAHEAINIQKRLKTSLVIKEYKGPIKYIAGADISSSRQTDHIWAGAVVLSFPELKKVEEKWIKTRTNFPYIPGLLSFRELPAIIDVFKGLKTDPDVILCDGQGIAHQRSMGIASHLGLLCDKPTIGCAKSRLVGGFKEPGNNKGDYFPLILKGSQIGVVLRSRSGVKPLFISPGNLITIDQAMEIVNSCCVRYRIPEPIRQSHILVNKLRKNCQGAGFTANP